MDERTEHTQKALGALTDLGVDWRQYRNRFDVAPLDPMFAQLVRDVERKIEAAKVEGARRLAILEDVARDR